DAGGAPARGPVRREGAVRVAARPERPVRAALVALLAHRPVDRAVAAQRGELDGHEVAVGGLVPARVARIAAGGAAGGRPARLALPDGRLARVAPDRAAPGEAERVRLADIVAHAEDHAGGGLIDHGLLGRAGGAEPARIAEAEAPRVESDVRAAGGATRVGRAA